MLPQPRSPQMPCDVQRSPPRQSASVVQSRTQALKVPHEVPEGQSDELLQPLQMPPGAVVVQVLEPGQSPLMRHCTSESPPSHGGG